MGRRPDSGRRFPDDSARRASDLVDPLHRYAALIGLICLPIAGLRLARRLRRASGWHAVAVPVRVLSLVSLLGTAAFLATFAPLPSPVGLLGARGYSGITERVPLAADIAILATLAAAVLNPATRPTTEQSRALT